MLFHSSSKLWHHKLDVGLVVFWNRAGKWFWRERKKVRCRSGGRSISRNKERERK
jgi:hypothetical protein